MQTITKTRRGIMIFIFSSALILVGIGGMAAGCAPNQATLPSTDYAIAMATAPADYRYAQVPAPASGETTLDVLAPINAQSIASGDQQYGGDTSTVQSGQSTTEQEQPRVILRDAVLNITIQDVAAKVAEIDGLAGEMGGWVVSSSTSESKAYTGETLTYGNITVRVPAEHLDEAVDRIKVGAETVNSESITGRDVTQQYVDLSSRLKNLEAAEEQLQTIMDKAIKVEDVLSVYSELVTIRGDIESIKGQLQYFDQASAYSSIAVTLNPIAPSPVTTQASGWNAGKTIERALSALIGLGQGLVDLLITLVVVILPPALILGIPAWLIFRQVRRTSAAVTIAAASSTKNPTS